MPFSESVMAFSMVLRCLFGFERSLWSWDVSLYLRCPFGSEKSPWFWFAYLVLRYLIGFEMSPCFWDISLVLKCLWFWSVFLLLNSFHGFQDVLLVLKYLRRCRNTRWYLITVSAAPSLPARKYTPVQMITRIKQSPPPRPLIRQKYTILLFSIFLVRWHQWIP